MAKRLLKVISKETTLKKVVTISGDTIGDVMLELGVDRAETEDGFELGKSVPLDDLSGAPIIVSTTIPSPPPSSTHGHLFISRSDIRYLLTDAWLIPSNEWISVNRHWVPDNDDLLYGSFFLFFLH